MIPTWIRLFFRKGHQRPRTKPNPAGPAATRNTEDPVTHETPSKTGHSPADTPTSSSHPTTSIATGDGSGTADSTATAASFEAPPVSSGTEVPAVPTGADQPCPACGEGVPVAGDVELGEVLYCAHCGAELEVIQREPLLLDLFEEEEK